jgi:hypothetical protein
MSRSSYKSRVAAACADEPQFGPYVPVIVDIFIRSRDDERAYDVVLVAAP